MCSYSPLSKSHLNSYSTLSLFVSLLIIAFSVRNNPSCTSTGLNVMIVSSAVGIIWISYKKKVFQSVTLNIFWVLIGIIAILRFFLL